MFPTKEYGSLELIVVAFAVVHDFTFLYSL